MSERTSAFPAAGEPVAAPSVAAARTVSGALLEASRPRQWSKNLLVLAAPFAGGALFTRASVTGVVLSFLAFTAASAGCYLVNDVTDAVRDRLHPDKRHRPVASGRLRRSVP